MTYAVTGSTGPLGTLAVQHLIALKVPASSIVALARDPKKATLPAGVQIRRADYSDPASLDAALKGVDRLLLISGSEVGQRVVQHQNVITAAKKAGVKLVAYTSITHADTTTNPLAPEHKATEANLKASGLPFVLLRHNWYVENHKDDLAVVKATGVLAAAVGQGRIAAATRSDLAEADVRALVGEGHAGKTYELAGTPWTYTELAAAMTEVLGRPVAYQALSPDERTKALLAAGLPEGVAGFVTALDLAVADGTLDLVSPDLETLLGRKPASLREGLKSML